MRLKAWFFFDVQHLVSSGRMMTARVHQRASCQQSDIVPSHVVWNDYQRNQGLWSLNPSLVGVILHTCAQPHLNTHASHSSSVLF